MEAVLLTEADLDRKFREHGERILAGVSTLIKSDERPDHLTTREAAEYLRVTTRQVFNLKTTGKLPFIKAGRKILYPREGLEQYLRDRSVPAAAGSQ